MNKCVGIIIRKVGNGYVVTPSGESFLCENMFFFQKKGHAISSEINVDTEETLLEFIAKHFTE